MGYAVTEEIKKELSRLGLDQEVFNGAVVVGDPIIVEDIGNGIVVLEEPFCSWTGSGKIALGVLRNFNELSHKDFWTILQVYGEVMQKN